MQGSALASASAALGVGLAGAHFLVHICYKNSIPISTQKYSK